MFPCFFCEIVIFPSRYDFIFLSLSQNPWRHKMFMILFTSKMFFPWSLSTLEWYCPELSMRTEKRTELYKLMRVLLLLVGCYLCCMHLHLSRTCSKCQHGNWNGILPLWTSTLTTLLERHHSAVQLLDSIKNPVLPVSVE